MSASFEPDFVELLGGASETLGRGKWRFRERVLFQFRSPQNLEYLAGLFRRDLPSGPLLDFALDTLTDAAYAFERGETLIYSDPLAERGENRPAADLWGEIRRLNLAFYRNRMDFVRDKASLIEGRTGDGQFDDDEPYHYRMFVADSLRPPGLTHLNGTGPLYGIREDQVDVAEPHLSASVRASAVDHGRPDPKGVPSMVPRAGSGACPLGQVEGLPDATGRSGGGTWTSAGRRCRGVPPRPRAPRSGCPAPTAGGCWPQVDTPGFSKEAFAERPGGNPPFIPGNSGITPLWAPDVPQQAPNAPRHRGGAYPPSELPPWFAPGRMTGNRGNTKERLAGKEAPYGGPSEKTTLQALPPPGVDERDWGWDGGNPNRTPEQAVAEYWGEQYVESSEIGATETGGKAYGDARGWGNRWRENGGTRFQRYDQIPFWHEGGVRAYELDIEETLGSGSRELDTHVRRWDMDRVRHPRGEEYRRYGYRTGEMTTGYA